MKTLKTLAFLTLTLILFSGISASFAGEKTWVGNTTEWYSKSNWNPLGVPTSKDDVIIPSSPSGGNMPILSSGTQTILTLDIQASAILNQTGGTLIVSNLAVNASGSYLFSGTALSVSGNFTNLGSVTLNPGEVRVVGQITTEVGGDLTIAGATVKSAADAIIKGTMYISSGSFVNAEGNKLIVDSGTFTQTSGTVSTKDMEIKNGGTYNQSAGELQIDNNCIVKSGSPTNTFIGTGGTVRFTGDGNGEYYGNVQFHNVIVDADAKLKMDNDNDNIKISGNFTNNNPDLDNDKGTVTFNGTDPQTIYSASTPLPATTTYCNLVIDKPSGTIQLSSDLAVETFTETSRTLDLDGHILWVGGVPLPVELSSFSAVLLENSIRLNWRTETEVSNYGFEILRSAQDDRWDIIGFVEGNGNSNSPKNYSFVDQNVTGGKPAYRTGRCSYRLKQIDTDGKFEYSKVIEVDLGSPISYELSQNYPNPFNPSTTIRFSVSESSFINLSVFNSLGEEVKELVNEVKEPGIYTIEFSAQKLTSGTYFYRLHANDFTQIKKMILLK